MIKAPLSKILEGQPSLLEWIDERAKKGYLESEEQYALPDFESQTIAWDGKLDEISMLPGLIDGVINRGNDSTVAQTLINYIKSIEEYQDNNESLELYLGGLYGLLMENSTISYVDEFLRLLVEEQEEIRLDLLHKVAWLFATSGIHREPVKWGLFVVGVLRNPKEDEEELKIYQLFGLCDEFSKFCGFILERYDLNDEIFSLAKVTHGWGRVNYLKCLEPCNEVVRRWFIYEGYKNDIDVNHTALECVLKGNLLFEIEQYGWSEELYTASGELLLGLVDDGPTQGVYGYKDSKDVIISYVKESHNQEKTLHNFWILCELFFTVKNFTDEEGWSVEERESTINLIGDMAFRLGMDWEPLIIANVTDYKARQIAKAMGLDIWEYLFDLACHDEAFSEWYALTQTDDPFRYRRLCNLASEKLPLSYIASGPKDELGLSSAFHPHMDLGMIIQRLDGFSERIGVDLVKTALNSPVTSNRNMALRVLKTWETIPADIHEILRINREIEPYKDALSGYDELLNKVFQEADSEQECLDAYASMFNTLDARGIEPYLAENVTYASQNVLEDLEGKAKVMEYFHGKVKTLKALGGTNVFAQRAYLENDHRPCILMAQGDRTKHVGVLLIKINQGKIVHFDMCSVVPNPSDATPKGVYPMNEYRNNSIKE